MSTQGRTGRAQAEPSCYYRDKLEMINTATDSIPEPCVLFQVDIDELWSTSAIVSAYRTITDAGVDCIRTHCHFFVAPNLVTVSSPGYGHSSEYEWTRVWRFQPGDT